MDLTRYENGLDIAEKFVIWSEECIVATFGTLHHEGRLKFENFVTPFTAYVLLKNRLIRFQNKLHDCAKEYEYANNDIINEFEVLHHVSFPNHLVEKHEKMQKALNQIIIDDDEHNRRSDQIVDTFNRTIKQLEILCSTRMKLELHIQKQRVLFDEFKQFCNAPRNIAAIVCINKRFDIPVEIIANIGKNYLV